VREDLERRDRADSTRRVSPLQPAEDALVLDTTNLAVADIVSKIVERFRLATHRTPGETGAS
jgi:cytidylate kinase